MARTQAERRATTRKKLLDAAVKVIRKRGYLGFTMQEAAKVAGLTRGAPVHYFTSAEAFQIAALEYLFETMVVASTAAVGKPVTVDSVLEGIMRDAHSWYFREDFLTGIDTILSARKHAKTRKTVRSLDSRYMRPSEEMWRDQLVAVGVPIDAAEKVVWIILSIARGAAIRSLIMEEPAGIEAMLEFSLVIVRAFLRGFRTADGSKHVGS